MRLMKYVKGSEITVHFGNEDTGVVEHTSVFSPEGEVPDEFVERLLSRHPGKFEVVSKPEVRGKVICPDCKGEFKNEAGLLIHKKRKHKEPQ